MQKTLRSFYGGSNADLGPVSPTPSPQTGDYLRWSGAYWAPASFEEPEKNLKETVRNAGFTMLPKGTPVRITGNSGQEANVIAANATDSFPAHLILNQDLLAGATGEAVAIGFINNVPVPDASLFSGGQEVYLGPAGGWTTTRPTGTNKIQKLGIIVKPNTGANTVSGIISISNIQDLPNLAQGKVWVGDATGLPQEATPNASTLGLGTIASQDAISVDITGGVITSTNLPEINRLSDVDTVTAFPTTGQYLGWNGTANWIPISIPHSIIISCSGATEFISLGTAKETFRADRAFNLTSVRASLSTAATGSNVIVDINLNGTSILGSNKININSSQKSSVGATPQATITTSSIPLDGEITIDIDQVGSTLPGQGLKVYLIGTLA